MFTKQAVALVMVCLMAFLPSCISTGKSKTYQELTPEQRAKHERMRQKLLAKFNGVATGNSFKHIPKKSNEDQGYISEEELQEKLARYTGGASNVHFQRSKDGLIANGQNFLDSEGRIESFGFDYSTGDITYLVKTGYDYKIKYVRFGSEIEPITLADVTKSRNVWNVQTVTGKSFNGPKLIPASCGFVVARPGAAFFYKPGDKTYNFTPDEDFHIAYYQNGDIATTGYILLERDYYTNKTSEFFGTLVSLGSSLGINKKEDYKLVNIFDGKTYPLNVSMDDKMTNALSDCKKKSKHINECSTLHRFESLYQVSGNKNSGHYFWRINWFNTDIGPLMVAIEDGVTSLNAMSLVTGEKVTLVERLLGINKFDAEQDANGVVKIDVQLGFSSETIDNLSESYLLKVQENTQAAVKK